MADRRRSPLAARLIIALTALAALGVLVVLLVQSSREGRVKSTAPSTAPAPAPAVPAASDAPIPVEPVLGRADLIGAAAAAASAYAVGETAVSAQEDLVGRRFRIRLPFGCSGESSADGGRPASWTRAQDGQSITVRVAPENWTDSAFVREIQGDTPFDAVEGFWIPRPWVRSEECPVQQTDPLQTAPPPPSPQTVGLAEFHQAGSDRTRQRRDRPYEVTIKTPAGGEDPAPQGFSLVLSGRVIGFGERRAFRCRSASAEQRPVCVARVELDDVELVDPATGRSLARWPR